MNREIRVCHLAGEDERHGTGHEAHEHEGTADRLDDSGSTSKRRQIEWRAGLVEGKTKELLRPVRDEQKRYDDSKNAQQIRRPRRGNG
jgi:hypothetical protein